MCLLFAVCYYYCSSGRLLKLETKKMKRVVSLCCTQESQQTVILREKEGKRGALKDRYNIFQERSGRESRSRESNKGTTHTHTHTNTW